LKRNKYGIEGTVAVKLQKKPKQNIKVRIVNVRMEGKTSKGKK
jgi:hypothetical protein